MDVRPAHLLALCALVAAPGRPAGLPDRATPEPRRAAIALIRSGDFPRAAALLRTELKDHPQDPELHRLLAYAALDQAIEMRNRVEDGIDRLLMLRAIRKVADALY